MQKKKKPNPLRKLFFLSPPSSACPWSAGKSPSLAPVSIWVVPELGSPSVPSAGLACGPPRGIINTFPSALCGSQITTLGANAGRHWYDGNEDGAWGDGGRCRGSAPRGTRTRDTGVPGCGCRRRLWRSRSRCDAAAGFRQSWSYKSRDGKRRSALQQVERNGRSRRACSRDEAAPGNSPPPNRGALLLAGVSSAC